MKMPIKNNIHNMAQGPPNPGFKQEKVKKGDFLKKAIARIEFFFVVLGSSKAWNAKFEAASFFAV